MLNRRAFAAGAAAGFGLLAASPALAARPVREKALSLVNLHTGESLRTVYWAEGTYVPSSLAELGRLLRDHRTDQVHPLDPAVYDLIHALAAKLRTRQPFHIISGYRSPQTNAMLANASAGVARHSLHMDGKAVDLRVPGMSAALVGKAARNLKRGGVGVYGAANFVHIDTGRVRYW